MVKKLTQIGSSLGLIIDKPVLDLLEIDRETPLVIRTDGRRLIIEPQRTADADRQVRRAIATVAETYADTFKKLA